MDAKFAPHIQRLREVDTSVFLTGLSRAAWPVMVDNLITLDRKQQDYGSANLTKFGVFGVAVRMNDKMERIVNLLQRAKDGQTAQNESLADSFLDISNYGLIGYVMQTGIWPKQ